MRKILLQEAENGWIVELLDPTDPLVCVFEGEDKEDFIPVLERIAALAGISEYDKFKEDNINIQFNKNKLE